MATMASGPQTPPTNGQFQQWSFEKAMLEAQQRSPSESSSADFYEAEEKVRITPNIEDLKRTIEEQKGPSPFNEKYMSSEEALSPTDQEDDTDDESIYDGEASIKFAVCDMAIAICIISAGKAQLVDLPVPSLTSSPSIASEVERPERIDSIPNYSIPRKPVLRERNPLRPTLRNLNTTNTSPNLHTQSAAEVPSHKPTYSDEIDAQSTASFRSSLTQPAFLSQDPYANSSPPRANHSRLRNLSTKIGRFALYGPSGKPVEEPVDIAEEIKPLKVSTPKKLRRGSFHLRSRESPVSATSEPSPTVTRKLVPRGAAERAPPIEIPPCPYDLDEDGDLPQRLRRRKSSLGF